MPEPTWYPPPPPPKTQAELDREETLRDWVDETDARHPAVGWALVVLGACFALGGIIRACW